MKSFHLFVRRHAGAVVRRLLPLPVVGPLLVTLIRFIRPDPLTAVPGSVQTSDFQLAQLREDVMALTRAVERMENALYLQQVGTLSRSDFHEPSS